MLTDYEAKRFKDVTIGANESAKGFVYFSAPEDDPKFGEVTLHFRVIDTSEGTFSNVAVPFG